MDTARLREMIKPSISDTVEKLSEHRPALRVDPHLRSWITLSSISQTLPWSLLWLDKLICNFKPTLYPTFKNAGFINNKNLRMSLSSFLSNDVK
jgi:hypothetical protein